MFVYVHVHLLIPGLCDDAVLSTIIELKMGRKDNDELWVGNNLEGSGRNGF